MFDKETTDQIVKMAVVKALGDDAGQNLLMTLVDKLLATKVNKNGHDRYDNFGGSPDTPLLDYFLNNQLKHVIERAVVQYVSENSEELIKSIKIKLEADDGIATNIVNMMRERLESGYISVKLNIQDS